MQNKYNKSIRHNKGFLTDFQKEILVFLQIKELPKLVRHLLFYIKVNASSFYGLKIPDFNSYPKTILLYSSLYSK